MMRSYFLNVTIIISLLYIIGQLFRNYSFDEHMPSRAKGVLGICFGFMGIILMDFTIPIMDGIIVDLRNIAILCALMLGGHVAMIIASIIILLFRVLYFGVSAGSIAAVITITISVGLVTLIFRKKHQISFIQFLVAHLLLIATAAGALITLLHEREGYQEFVAFYIAISFVSGLATYYVSRYFFKLSIINREIYNYRYMANEMASLIGNCSINGDIIYVSTYTEPLLGITSEKIIHHSLYEFIYEEDRDEVEQAIELLFNDHTQHRGLDVRIKHEQTDTYYWIELILKKIKSNYIDDNQVMFLMRDIHQRKQLEQEILFQKDQAQKANEMKNQFLANVSHELRTPLNSIIGFTTRVIRSSDEVLAEVQSNNLRIVKEESIHLLDLINDILDFSKIEAGKININIERFEVNKVIDEAFEMIENIMIQKKMHFVCQYEATEEVVMHSDRKKIKQILINLLANAFKYSTKGTVTIVTKHSEKSLQISVIDEGIGIETNEINTIFDAFHRINDAKVMQAGGTGLGLAITKRLIEALDGEIHVTSHINEGSTFYISLPINYDL